MDSIKIKAPILYKLASYISEFKNIDIDAESLNHTAKIAADTYGTISSGIKTNAYQKAFKSAELLFGSGDFDIPATEVQTSLLGSIFYHALAISSTDFDEGHRKAVGHPASAVVPVAIVLGTFLEKKPIDILKSIIVGYEIAVRFSMSRVKEKITSYSSGRWAAFGSAATVAYLLELSTYEIIHALSNSSILSPVMIGGSTDVSTGSMSKEGVAWAVQAGVQSAIMAKDGFSGPYLFVDEDGDYHTNILISGIGESYLINSNYFKPFACCRWLHSAISAFEDINKSRDLTFEKVNKIKVQIFSRAIDLIEEKYPDNTVKAQFHLPFAMALMLMYNKVSPELFCEENLQNNDIKVIIDKIELIANNDYTSAFPDKLPSKVEVYLFDGSLISKEIQIAPWDCGYHPSISELKNKFNLQSKNLEENNWDLIYNKLKI